MKSEGFLKFKNFSGKVCRRLSYLSYQHRELTPRGQRNAVITQKARDQETETTKSPDNTT